MSEGNLTRPFISLEEWLVETNRELEQVKARGTDAPRAIQLAVLCCTLEDEIEARQQ